MESDDINVDGPISKLARYSFQNNLCMLCQNECDKNGNKTLIAKPALVGESFQFYPNQGITWRDTILIYLKTLLSVATIKCHIARAQTAFVNKISNRSQVPLTSTEESSFTRSQSMPYQKNVCFFCDHDKTAATPLHTISSKETLDHFIFAAIEKSQNNVFRVKLSAINNKTDALSLQIKYHHHCWNENVVSVLKAKDISDPLYVENISAS